MSSPPSSRIAKQNPLLLQRRRASTRSLESPRLTPPSASMVKIPRRFRPCNAKSRVCFSERLVSRRIFSSLAFSRLPSAGTWSSRSATVNFIGTDVKTGLQDRENASLERVQRKTALTHDSNSLRARGSEPETLSLQVMPVSHCRSASARAA